MKSYGRIPALGAWGVTLLLLFSFNIAGAEEETASASLFPSDPVGAFLRAPGWEKEQAEDETFLDKSSALPEQVLETQAQMRKVDLDLARLQRDLNQLKNNKTTIKSKLGLSSETRFYSTLTPGNGAAPRLYSALRFNTPLAGRTNLYSELFLQAGPASTYNSYYLAPLSVTTNFTGRSGQDYRLQMGRFWIDNTYFTIRRAWREDDTWYEPRYTYDGILLSSRPFGLNWRGFLVRNTDGNGSRYDRYTIFSSAAAPIDRGEIRVTLLRVFDDTKTAASGAAYESGTVGLAFKYRGDFGGTGFQVSGETNINRLDQDKNGGPLPSWEYALRADGELKLKVPLKFNYYNISRDYPTANTAIQPLPAGFIWQYEENPWQPYYLSNLHYLELSTVPIQLGKWGNWTATGVYAKENTPTGKVAKSFSQGKLSYAANLDSFLSAPLAKGVKLTGELRLYNTLAPGELDVRQNVGLVSLARQVLPDVNLELGYQQFYLKDGLKEQQAQLQRVPFAIGNFRVFNSTLRWKYYPLFSQDAPVTHRHKLEWKTPVGPSTSLRLVFELSSSKKVNQTQRLAVEYWSGF